MLSMYKWIQRFTNYKDLQVHHIISLEEDYSKRLYSDNLITLCSYHHKQAEMNKISLEELKNLIDIPRRVDS